MKRFVPLLAIVLAGCVIHSLEPIGTEKSLVTPKEFLGQWRLVRGLSETDLTAKAIAPWELALTDEGKKTFRLVTFDEENARAEFVAHFFKIGSATFLDVVPDELGDDAKLNAYWRLSVHPVHGLAKVVATEDELRLHLMNYEWLKAGLKSKTLTLPYSGNLNDFVLSTATSLEWEAFLARYGSDTNAFPAKPALILKRVTAKKTP